MMAKRIDLRAYRDSIAERLAAASANESSPVLLGFDSGGEQWLIDLSSAGEVLPLPALTSVPLTLPWFAGLASAHGELQAVVDFSAFRGRTPTPQVGSARLLCVGNRIHGNVALLVDRICGLVQMSELQPVTDGASAPADAWRGLRMIDAQGNCWTCLDVESLLAAPDFVDACLPENLSA